MEKQIHGADYSAFLTVVIWGTTFVATKILLEAFLPIEILFFRFVLGYIALFAVSPHFTKPESAKRELLYAAAGLSGVCLYYFAENIALTYTLASNVSVMVSIAPFFTAILAHFLQRDKERIPLRFFLGFAIAITGIVMISLNGSSFELNPKGDILALAAALLWAVYSIITKEIGKAGDSIIRVTRHIFFYGILFMLPIFIVSGASFSLTPLSEPEMLFPMLFLGFGASALCFVTWNFSVRVLGAVKSSVYIYLVPVITIIFSAIILDEPVTLMIILGTLLTLLGLFISEKRG